MFDSMRIRTKLVAAVIIPLIALVGVNYTVVSTLRANADEAEATAAEIEGQVALATSSLGPGGVISALQDERNGESIELIGLAGVANQEEPEVLRDRTDEAIGAFTSRIAASTPEVQEAYAPAIAALDQIVEQRSLNDAYDGPRTTTEGAVVGDASFLVYSDVIQTMFDATSDVATSVNDPDLRAGATYFDTAARRSEAETRAIQVVTSQLFSGGSLLDDPVAFAAGTGFRAVAEAHRAELLRSPNPEYRELAERALNNPAREVLNALLDGAFTTGTIDITALTSPELAEAGLVDEAAEADAAQILTARADELVADARAEADDAAGQAQLATWILFVVLAAALVVTVLVSRSITKPLARLVKDADDMATKRLPGTVQHVLDAPLGEDVEMPELVEVSTSGGVEIAEVATALNSVQASAADLAMEQAVLRRNISDSFVNLGRRNQNLLSRQLDQITEMEHGASEPEELQKLFVLDHLATRMRRNAESLLLLAGLEPHRQWAAPVAIIDVLRGALGEVEDYERVDIQRLDEATITGSTAADLTHMVAELLENALNFSPPGRGVEIAGRTTPDGGYSLAIIDYGIGMDLETLATANRRLSGGESFTVAPSRYLGHYVVGIQARRLGVRVQLQETPAGGITARLDISSVIDAEAPRPAAAAASAEAAAPVAVASAQPTPPSAPRAVEARPVDEPLPQTAQPAPAQAAPVETTPSGYTKRVRGANVPRTDVVPARGAAPTDRPADEPSGSTADSMRSMLSGLQSGAERARNDLDAASAVNPEEDR